MKKKTFEIIEEGRFLKNGEMTEVTGGETCIFIKNTTCKFPDGRTYEVTMCAREHIVSCGATSAIGYRSCSTIGGKTICSSYQDIYPCPKHNVDIV